MPSTQQLATNSAAKHPFWHHPDAGWVLNLGGLSGTELAKRVFTESRSDDVLGRSAQLSFYIMLSFFPMVVFAASVLGLAVSNQQQISERILGYLQPVLPDPGYQLVRTTLDQILSTSHLRPLSLIFAIWSGSYGFEAVINGLNVAFDLKESRTWWKRRLVAITMTVVLEAGLAATVLLVMMGDNVERWLLHFSPSDEALQIGIAVTRWAVVLVFLIVVLTLVYQFAPNLGKQSILSMLPGSVVGILLWIAVSLGFRAWVQSGAANYETFYGALGAVIAFMLWLYLSSAALMVGAELNSEIRSAARDSGEVAAEAAFQKESG